MRAIRRFNRLRTIRFPIQLELPLRDERRNELCCRLRLFRLLAPLALCTAPLFGEIFERLRLRVQRGAHELLEALLRLLFTVVSVGRVACHE